MTEFAADRPHESDMLHAFIDMMGLVCEVGWSFSVNRPFCGSIVPRFGGVTDKSIIERLDARNSESDAVIAQKTLDDLLRKP